MKPKHFSCGHLTKTQKAAGPGEESIQNWLKFELKQIESFQYGAYGFKIWSSKTQPLFEISGVSPLGILAKLLILNWQLSFLPIFNDQPSLWLQWFHIYILARALLIFN